MKQENQLTVVGGSGQMFDRIAKRYDRMNRIISLGLDRGWRSQLVEELRIPENGTVLDVATGTGDVALAIASSGEGISVVGLDPSVGMLEVGREKVAQRDMHPRVRLDFGDAQEMPYENDAFDASCISFGIRNVPDREQGLREMVRVTRPGGRVCILELSEPRGHFLSPFARFHVHHVVPLLGALLSGSWEYRYLQKSIAAFPPPDSFLGVMEAAGMEECSFQGFLFGVAHLYTGVSPR